MQVLALAINPVMLLGTFPITDFRKLFVLAHSMIAAMASLSSKSSTLCDSSVNLARYSCIVLPLSCLILHRCDLDFFYATSVANLARNAPRSAWKDAMLPGLRLLNHSKPEPMKVRLKAWQSMASGYPYILIHVS